MDRVALCLVLTMTVLAPSVRCQSSTLMIQTCDDSRHRLPAVAIELENWSDPFFRNQQAVGIQKTTTGVEGEVWYFQLKPGNYRLRAFRNGFQSIESDLFTIDQRSVLFCTVMLVPLLPGIPQETCSRMTLRSRTFPVIRNGQISSGGLAGSSVIPEVMESLPGVTIHPESGIPRFASQRTSDVGLVVDGIPVQDPVDHRPAFFPPCSLTGQIDAVRAGQDADQQTTAGGAIIVRTRHSSGRKFSGLLGVSDVVANQSFIRDESSKDMFEYWRDHGGSSASFPRSNPDLEDRRYNLMLNSTMADLDMFAAIDWRKSNRGYTSDFVNSDSLDDINAWSKISYSGKGTCNILAGYQYTSQMIENQWELRGLPPLTSDRKNVFTGVHYRRPIFTSFWYAVTASALELSSNSKSLQNDQEILQNYPYDLEEWFSDDVRSAIRLSCEMGNTTRFHDIEAGFGISRLAMEAHEGFWGPTEPSTDVYEWAADIDDYEMFIWGHDRWFLSENLELGMALRWDRFNYLNQSDYLSPRIFFDWTWGYNRLAGGVERIVQSPGIGFISDQFAFPELSDELARVSEPQLGFRWYGGYFRTVSDDFRFSLSGYYSLLSRMIFMLPMETEPGIEFTYPATGESGNSMGAFFQAEWTLPVPDTVLKISYGYARSRVSWGDDIMLSHIKPYAELPWRRDFYSGFSGLKIPMDNELTHSFGVSAETVVPWLLLNISADYRVTTGWAYTESGLEGETEDRAIHAENGPAIHRMDVDIRRTFQLSPGTRLQFMLKVKNAFNAYQFPVIDPFSGEPVVDPYRLDHNQPRTLTAGFYLIF